MSTESRHLVGPARRQAESGIDARSPTADDAEALAVLMLDAYRGTVDADGSETIGMARREVNGYLAGDSGPPRLDVSRVVERDGRLAAAVLVSDYEDLPLIAYVMTASEHKRRGLATALMSEVLSALAYAGEREAHLWVTSANPAVRIYELLGFHDRADPPEG